MRRLGCGSEEQNPPTPRPEGGRLLGLVPAVDLIHEEGTQGSLAPPQLPRVPGVREGLQRYLESKKPRRTAEIWTSLSSLLAATRRARVVFPTPIPPEHRRSQAAAA